MQEVLLQADGQGYISMRKFEEDTMMLCAPPTLELLQKMDLICAREHTSIFQVVQSFSDPICQGEVALGGVRMIGSR